MDLLGLSLDNENATESSTGSSFNPRFHELSDLFDTKSESKNQSSVKNDVIFDPFGSEKSVSANTLVLTICNNKLKCFLSISLSLCLFPFSKNEI